ncbi:MAG: hypothetical protein IJH64_00635 [Oscillospiraceae bacterium]|nr:hypothetical protein [Oscillospiraceae bacterium]
MITVDDLDAAIAECQGERNPNANTCIKLAAYYTIRDHLTQNASFPDTGASYAPAPQVIETDERFIAFDKSTDFAKLIDGKDAYSVWAVMDELMQTLKLIMPQLYSGTMQKIRMKTK